MNAKVRPIGSAGKATVADVIDWTKQKSARGEIPSSSARLRMTSLKQLSSILGEDEPKEAEWLLANLEAVTVRFATLADTKGDTAKTYAQKAKVALEDYQAWSADPTGFKFRRRDSGPKPAGSEATRKPKPKEDKEVPPPTPERPQGLEGLRNFPLGDVGSFDFKLPDGGIDVRTWKKIACHLLTLANDFDPSTPGHAEAFSIVMRDR